MGPLSPSLKYLFLVLFVFLGVGGFPLFNNNEGLYAEIAREMLERGDFIVPYLNGVPYLEKPPFLYWLLCLGFSVFGVHDWVARLVASLSGVALMGVLFRRNDRMTALVIMSCPVIVISMKHLFFDGWLTAFLSGALLFFYRWNQEKKKAFLDISYALLALAVLTKGFVALILFGLTTLSYLLIQRQSIWPCFSLRSMAIFFAIALPWHVMAARAHPDFLWYYFVNEHVYRFLDMRVPKDYYTGPFYYYILRFFLHFFPVFFALPSLRKLDIKRAEVRFYMCWFITFFLFFTLSRAKANYYMLTAAVPIAFLLREGVRAWTFHNILPWISGGLMAVATLVFPMVEERFSSHFLFKTNFFEGKSVYLYKDFEDISSVVFYLKHPVPVIDSHSKDLMFGSQQPEAKGRFLSSDHHVFPVMSYVFMRPHQEKSFHKKFLGFCPFYKGHALTILTNECSRSTP